MIETVETIESPVPSVTPVAPVTPARADRAAGIVYSHPAHPPKPLLRGWIHAAAAIITLLLGVAVVTRSAPERWLPLAIFGVSVIELYSASAAFHILRWQGRLYICMRLLDHCSIFVMIAATATTFAALFPLFGMRLALIVLIWLTAAAGIALKVFYTSMSRTLSTLVYVGMGWVAGGVWLILWLAQRPSEAALFPLALAGTLYTLGAIIYTRRNPDWWPRVFGYHELFHVLVVLANTAIAVAILQIAGVPFIV